MGVSEIIAFVEFVVGILILVLCLFSLRNKRFFEGSVWLFVVALFYVLHASGEVFGWGDFWYSLSALVITGLLGFIILRGRTWIG